MVAFGINVRFFIKATASGNINLDADDWFNSVFFAFLIKLNDAIHTAVVSDGDCGHTQTFGFFDQIGDFN